jgi:pre-mRNA cleavage complex 2 protein Pcf11
MPECKSKAQNDKARAAAAAQEKETRLKDEYVEVPLGDEAKTVTCPICKEVLSPEFLEDEELVYKNAVNPNGKVRAILLFRRICFLVNLLQIYHATCYADASSAPNALITRIKQHLEQRSRSVTPDVDPKRAGSRSPISGILKRKTREDELESQVKVKVEDSPPLKRLHSVPKHNEFI